MGIITKEMLKESLSQLGVKKGMKIIVHSSLKSFGSVEGGADTVIDALTEVVTGEGIIMMPSFNHGVVYNEGGVFDVNKTPTTNGIIPETFRKRRDVSRSINPTHPFAVWGNNREYYVKDHQKTDSFGVDSPLYRLMEDGGYCLLLGVDYRRNTFHHCVEMCIKVPCLSPRGEEYPVRLHDGSLATAHTWGWREKLCEITDGGIYGDAMKTVEKSGMVGNSEAKLYKLSDGFGIIEECLKKGVNGSVNCGNCTMRPRICKWTVEKIV